MIDLPISVMEEIQNHCLTAQGAGRPSTEAAVKMEPSEQEPTSETSRKETKLEKVNIKNISYIDSGCNR